MSRSSSYCGGSVAASRLLMSNNQHINLQVTDKGDKGRGPKKFQRENVQKAVTAARETKHMSRRTQFSLALRTISQKSVDIVKQRKVSAASVDHQHVSMDEGK